MMGRWYENWGNLRMDRISVSLLLRGPQIGLKWVENIYCKSERCCCCVCCMSIGCNTCWGQGAPMQTWLELRRETLYSFSWQNTIHYPTKCTLLQYTGLTGSALFFQVYKFNSCGPSSSVGVATDYELDGLGSNPSGDEIFRPSRPALGPTQPPVKWIPCLSRG